LSYPLLSNKYPVLRIATILALVILSLPSLTTLSVRSQPYSLKYDLGYSGVPFPGGVISVASNFTNTGQLTVRVTSISFASDFWTNGGRQITLGFPFNLSANTNKMINTAVLIHTRAMIGNHNIRATAAWQYSNSSGTYTASPIVASITVTVSQTLDSLFSSLAAMLLVGLGVVGVVVVLVALLVIRRRKKQRSISPSSAPQTN
jgi:hypothetical protein